MKRAPLYLLLLVAVTASVWFYPLLRSLAVMSVYSDMSAKQSLMAKNDFHISIPGGLLTPERDWYPFPMIFNAGEFTDGAEMTIIYNFPAFDPLTRTSSLYDTDSVYYSSFYGAYVIKTTDGNPYGYKKNKADPDEITKAFRYDYVNLVLESFADGNFTFDPIAWEVADVKYLGYEEWKRIDAIVNTNGTSHRMHSFRRSYLQYGVPLKTTDTDFPLSLFFGRLYMRYFEEFGCTIVLYIMTTDKDVLHDCDERILSLTRIYSE